MLTDVARQIESILRATERGAKTTAEGEWLKPLEARQAELKAACDRLASPAPRLTVDGAALYRAKVAGLAVSLNDSLIRAEATQALRALIEKVVLTPEAAAPDGLSAQLNGELAAILVLAQGLQNAVGTCVPGSQISVVAGTGFEPVTFRL